MEGYCACTILLTEMKDTVKSMTREEVNRIRQREFYGSAWSAGEKHPFLTHPLNLFFGIWVVPMWGYYWVHTAAQIELGLIDCPIIVYERGKETERWKRRGPEFEKADALDVVNKADEWQKKYGNAPKGKGVRISLEGLKMLKKDNGGK